MSRFRSLLCIAAAAALATGLAGCGKKGGLDAPPAFSRIEPTVPAAESTAGVTATEPAPATAYAEPNEVPPPGPATAIVPAVKPVAPAAPANPANGPFRWTPLDWLID